MIRWALCWRFIWETDDSKESLVSWICRWTAQTRTSGDHSAHSLNKHWCSEFSPCDDDPGVLATKFWRRAMDTLEHSWQLWCKLRDIRNHAEASIAIIEYKLSGILDACLTHVTVVLVKIITPNCSTDFEKKRNPPPANKTRRSFLTGFISAFQMCLRWLKLLRWDSISGSFFWSLVLQTHCTRWRCMTIQ